MFAIVEIKGKQYRIQPKSKIQVDLVDSDPGKNFPIDKVLLMSEDDGTKCEIGTPYLKHKINSKVIDHVKGEKITIFKKKSKKRYERTRGHRQKYTLLEIGDFI